VNVSANTITLLLMGGGACLAGSIFVYRRNFSLRFLLICVFVIGLIGMVPGKIVKTPTAIMSSQYLFDKPFSSDQMQRLKTEMAPPRALATLPEQMLEELKISPATDIGRVIVAPADAHKPGAYLEISFSPQINREQREAIAEFYAYHFGQLCLEMAQANSSSNATTSSRPTVNNRFYKYLKEWEARRAEKLAEPER